MPNRLPRLPKYRHYKPKDLAVVRIRGKDHDLGKFGSEASLQKYRRLIADLLATSSPLPHHTGHDESENRPMVDVLLVRYWDRHVTSYDVKEGRPTSEQDNIRQALRFVHRLYGQFLVRHFGPHALKLVRQAVTSGVKFVDGIEVKDAA